jgi:LmbE family N-acetylglucosaminyl deacetylase
MNFRNVLVVAAHPDDEVLGVGGTIPIIKEQGGRVSVVIVTDGSSTQYAGDSEILERKQGHCNEANRILGTDEVIQWDFPDMRLDTVEHFRLNQAFENLIHERKFDTVFVQNGDDINLDHQLIYKSVMVATRPLPNQPVQQVLSYQVNSSTEWGGRTQNTIFCPNFFVDISHTLEIKLAAMEVYVDELRDYPHPRSIQALRQRSMVYGNEVGYESAEPFKLLLYRGALGKADAA